MYDFPIALQLYSVRHELQADFEGTLQKVKEMGYDGVEFAGLYGFDPKDVKALVEKYALQPISAHIPFSEMLKDPDVLKIYKEIGCEFAVIPGLSQEYRPGEPKFPDLIEAARMLTKKAQEIGMKFCYHNHDFEFVKLGDEYAIDYFYREVPDIMAEFDTCWVKVGGADPVEYLKKYADREEITHLKDYCGSKSQNMYQLIGINENEKPETKDTFEFRPLGKGVQDVPSLLASSKEIGIRWVVVEQDSPTPGMTPLECAKASIDYLKSIY